MDYWIDFLGVTWYAIICNKGELMSMKKIIVEELKKQGLDLAEDAAEDALEGFFSGLEKIVTASDNKYDDMLVPVLGMVKPKILEMINKIDKSDNVQS